MKSSLQDWFIFTRSTWSISTIEEEKNGVNRGGVSKPQFPHTLKDTVLEYFPKGQCHILSGVTLRFCD